MTNYPMHPNVNAELAATIWANKEHTPYALHAGSHESLMQKIAVMELPLGHGTSSEHLGSILEFGLGAIKPSNSYSPQAVSACDLLIADGLLACYAFATWNDFNALCVDSSKVTGRDIVDRYAAVNPKVSSWWKKYLLRRITSTYLKKRGQRIGYPILLIYDGAGTSITYRNKSVPSEIICNEYLARSRLRIVLAPASKYAVVKSLLMNVGCSAEIVPMELLELAEIHR